MTKLDRLIKGLKPRAVVPRGFGLWSRTLQIIWLNQNQKPKK